MKKFWTIVSASVVVIVAICLSAMHAGFAKQDKGSKSVRSANIQQVTLKGADSKEETISIEESTLLFQQVKHFVKKFYYNQSEVKDDESLVHALKGFVSGLDPHSAYLTAKELSSIQESINGHFYGVGIAISTKDGYLYVIASIEGTPAHKAGLKSGDYITHIDNKSTFGMSIEECSKMLRGKKGTKVKVFVVRDGEPKPISFTLKRDKISTKSVSYKYYKNGYLYLKIRTFIETTYLDISEVISRLKSSKSKINGIILDLRDNPGGILDQAVLVSDLFLSNGVVTSIKSRKTDKDPEDEEVSFVDANCKCSEKMMIVRLRNVVYLKARAETLVSGQTPVVVMVNSGSASAAEIVAAALQENDRAVVVGEKTFGKGSVQTLIPIYKDQKQKDILGAIKLTTSRYYTPSGESIQNLGVTPDITVPQAGEFSKKEQTEAELALLNRTEKDLKNHLLSQAKSDLGKNGNSKEKWQEFDRYTDYQLTTAMDIVQGMRKTVRITKAQYRLSHKREKSKGKK